MNPVRIVVDSRIRLPIAELPSEAVQALRASFTHANPDHGGKWTPDAPEHIRTWREEDDACVLSLPRGGMPRVRAALREHGLKWWVDDRRTWEHPERGFPDHLREERPYQTRMRLAAERRENCLLHGSTGSGKTTVLYSLVSRLKRRALVMVWTEALLRQWRERAAEELGMMGPSEVGIIQGSTERIEPLTIAMQQTVAARFAKGDHSLASAFDVLCYDEVQRAAADTCYAAVDPFTARYRIGVSADSSRRDEKEFLIHDLFGDVAEEIGEDETIDAGATVDVEVMVLPTKFLAAWYKYRQDFKKLVDQMTADEERNALILRCAKKVAEQGEQVLVFTHRIEHARELDARLCAAGVPSGCLLGGAAERIVFQRTVAGLKSGELRAGCGTFGAIGQGLDLPTVSRGIVATPISNNKQMVNQVRGRLCRSAGGKERGKLYVMHDVEIYGRKAVKNFAAWFRTVRVWSERERAWVEAAVWLRDRAA